ncbi:hypothetical protein BDW02DRAFT_116181 [Decorospora gaudefroyi]|uniref:Myb-like domain-containing protein n=1 Tax=Decorospora gaudefroyi TaxID=184978 RepID=A0A6A5K9Q1_9PLEO|nr:hypothetical protein BDW02DRAFT_116181 [Decorospora gaudefroyi]
MFHCISHGLLYESSSLQSLFTLLDEFLNTKDVESSELGLAKLASDTLTAPDRTTISTVLLLPRELSNDVKSQRIPWSQGKTSQLYSYREKGLAFPKIAEELGRTVFACRNHYYNNGLPKSLKIKRPPWSTDEIQDLLSYREQGLTYRRIAEILDRTTIACRVRYTLETRGEHVRGTS